MNAKPRGRKRTLLVVAGGLLAIIGIIAVGVVWVDRTLKPSQAEVETIEEGMSKKEVTNLLGALYDEAPPDEISGLDRIMPDRDQVTGVTSVMIYQMSRSIDQAWILLDERGRVLKCWIKEKDEWEWRGFGDQGPTSGE